MCAALIEVFMTGGIPPLVTNPCPAETLYKSTYNRVLDHNARFYERFPGDVAVVGALVTHLQNLPGGGIQTPNGTWLRPRTLQLLGVSGVPLLYSSLVLLSSF
jgi:hypothetical protein